MNGGLETRPNAVPMPVSPIKRLVRRTSPRLRARVHWWMYDTPVLSEFCARRDRTMQIAYVGPETQLVLDGFPRSANSFSRAAFMHANGSDTPISTHGHSHRFAERGVQLGIPVIVLVRHPEPALASFLQYQPEMRLRALAKAYTRYYSGILPLIDSVLVARFEDVTTDFGAVIQRCNDKFGSRFEPYVKSPHNDAQVHAHIDAGTINVVGVEKFERVVPRPGFRDRDQTVFTHLTRREEAALLEARDTYERLLTAAGHQLTP